MISDQKPAPEAVHVMKYDAGKYYWVPISYRYYFFRLDMLTTAHRGQALLPADEFFHVTLTDIVKEEPSKSNPANFTFLTFKLDKKIPSDTGYIIFDERPDGTVATEPAGKTAGVQHAMKPSESTTGSETELITFSVANADLRGTGQCPRSARSTWSTTARSRHQSPI